MNNSVVRIESIEIQNFKNVKYGKVDLENSRKDFSASLLGVYGQNGSGKTALIDAIHLLKYALCGQPIPVRFSDFINVDAASACMKYVFRVDDKARDGVYHATYEFSIRKDEDDTGSNTIDASASKLHKATVFNEKLSYSYENATEKHPAKPIIDTCSDEVFIPKTKYIALVGTDKDVKTELLVAKKIAAASSRSFVFSKELLDVIRRNCEEKQHVFLINSLVNFGNYELFVINTSNAGLISMDALPLVFKYVGASSTALGSMMLSLNGPSIVSEETMDVARKVIDNMNIVLTQIIPGLTIGIKDLGTQLMGNGKTGFRIQLVSKKNSKEIPLQYESEGIKKIVSVLQLLVVVYNNPSITVAIDELDSGIFEYLLGELLRIISEKGKGQLIFTSHNLRPLETIDRGFIAFTTTNPENRYIRLCYVKPNNNLRDFYYRDIVLGEQSELIYEPTNNYEIALAFREAGEHSGS